MQRFKLPKSLVETHWVQQNLSKLQTVDASWHMPSTSRKARDEFHGQQLPQARFFDIDECSDLTTTLPHMLPKTPQDFHSYLAKAGISKGEQRAEQLPIVVYDNSDVCSSYRVYWMFRVFGYDNVAVMNGGMKKWLMDKYPVVSSSPGDNVASSASQISSVPLVDKSILCGSYEEILEAINNPKEWVIIDARSKGRFDGSQPEPRPGLPSGHMPNSINLPFTELISATYKTLLPVNELKRKFHIAGYTGFDEPDHPKNIVFSCGSGVTASVVYFAAEQILQQQRDSGKKKQVQIKVYDGSWSEYATISRQISIG